MGPGIFIIISLNYSLLTIECKMSSSKTEELCVSTNTTTTTTAKTTTTTVQQHQQKEELVKDKEGPRIVGVQEKKKKITTNNSGGKLNNESDIIVSVDASASAATTTTTTNTKQKVAAATTAPLPNPPTPQQQPISTASSLSTIAANNNKNNNNMAAVVAVQRTNKPCCFCWCCCCTCSCLAVKSGDELNSKNKEANYLESLVGIDGEPPPTLDDIRTWGQSFDKLMKSAAGRKVFRDFLKCEYSEENILFWLACEDLKRECNPEIVEEKARFIYEDYISILSPKEVSLDSRVREIVNKNMVDPTPHTFDEAQLQIYTLMHRDSYPRFINSHIFKRLAQLNNNTPSSPQGGSTHQQASSSSRKESFA